MTNILRVAGTCLAILSLSASLSQAVYAADGEGDSRRFTPFVRAVDRACQSTVDIRTEKQQKSLDVVFSASKSSKINGMGTGIIIDERGYIVTNYHVVEGVDKLTVILNDKSTFDAIEVRSDPIKDIAVIKIEAGRSLPVMPIGTSSDLMLCEEVVALGNAYGYEHSATKGIISSLGRNVAVTDDQGYKNLIQTDAAINPGNSGGPLLNANGELIGINVAIRQGAQQIGFAIPIDDARLVVAQLLNAERSTRDRTFHGVNTADIKNGRERKLVIQTIEPNSPAANAGLQAGDVIRKTRGMDVVDSVDLERSLLGLRQGMEVPLTIERNGEQKSLSLTLSPISQDLRSIPSQAAVASAKGLPAPRTGLAGNPQAPDKTWNVLGIRLAAVPNSESLFKGQSFAGGMRVTDVRPLSPAEQNGIKPGDVLVGLHIWETVTEENVSYVLNHPDLQSKLNPLKFYILRDGAVLFGHFQNLAVVR